MSLPSDVFLCDICCRPHHPTRLPFLCAVDARNLCYETRVRVLQVLLENESLRTHVDGLLSQSDREMGSTSRSLAAPMNSLVMESLVSRRSITEDRTAQIMARAEKLRADIEAARTEIQAKREANSRRRSDLVSASSGIDIRRTRTLDDTESMALLLRRRWDCKSDQTAATRAFLCMEAAKLYGLRRIKKGASKYEFRLGGIDVIDLTSMNALPPEVISTSLSHISHILILASHYLALRLPAEISMPHRDHPRPTIYNLASSYRHMEGDGAIINGINIKNNSPISGNLGNNELSSGLTGDRHARDTGSSSRPRPLFIEKPLSVLAKEDPAAHSFFLEGVTLLAYNVAWACLTQNVPIGDRGSFDDVCNMGRNLYNLLIGQQLHSIPTAKVFPYISSPTASDVDELDRAKQATAPPMMGRFSHGTTHSFLAGATGTEFVRSFKLPSPIKLADKLKKKLLSELNVPEWEVVEDGDWEIDGGM
ncbi:hypothetical protein jhhlp_004473 [Lomentospora prolificans]|uniref:Autophagy-related protein 14 n=1 Tax=Lomentospora prolificans TaxID=41688 RepID=A0A2N3NBN5_9PEZI|nr:hypothetical protein jhhlp_004473 [Lomentospora prolificans]